MKYFINEMEIIFEFSGRDGPRRSVVSIEGISDVLFLEKVMSVICIYAAGKTNYTQISYVSAFVVRLCSYLKFTSVSIPATVDEWNRFILNFMRFFLGDDFFGGAMRVKFQQWQYKIAPIFDLLCRESVIPYEVTIPRINIKTEIYNSNFKKTLNSLKYDKSASANPISKLLVDTSFSKTDVDFLAHLHEQCRLKVEVLKNIVVAHWNHFVADHLTFNEMASEIGEDQFRETLNLDNSLRIKAPQGYRYICSPAKEYSVNWAFAIVRHLLLNGMDVTCVSLERLRALPYFRKNALGTNDYKKILEQKTAMPLHAFNHLSSSNVMYRFAGLLSSVEFSAVCAILIIEHPNFNPLSIKNAKISLRNGKSHFVYTDEQQKIIFSVDKPRAGVRKSAVLTELAGKVISELIELTNPVRKVLIAMNHPDSDYLFLGVNIGGMLGRNIASLTDSLTAEKGQSLSKLYPELEKNNLVRGNLTFRSIRNTMGFLGWFESGSITEMSRILGNSEKVCLESYLPPEILNAWNTRIIRRHQNTLIILAAHDEKYLLEVTDFSNESELCDFIFQLLSDNSYGDNPLSHEVKVRLSSGDVLPQSSSSLLNIKLCEKSLAYLYVYTDWALENISKCLSDKSKSLVELSLFIRHTCESDDLSSMLSNTLDIAKLKKIHFLAVNIKNDMDGSIDLLCEV